MLRKTLVSLGAASVVGLSMVPMAMAETTDMNATNSTTVSADAVNSMSSQTVNALFTHAGYPTSLINALSTEEKRAMIARMGTDFRYVSSDIKNLHRNSDGSYSQVSPLSMHGISPLTISTTDLTLIESVGVDGYGNYYVYNDFTWNKEYSINNDHFSIAVPDGWNIVAGSYVSHTWYYPDNTGNWIPQDNLAGGRPDSIDMYGADWNYQISVGELLDQASYCHFKGMISLEMRRGSSTAQRRVVGSYASVSAPTWGSVSVGIAWKALSVTYTPGGGTGVNTAGDDTSF